MASYTNDGGSQRGGGGGPQVVCAWCGGVMREAESKDALRMCQPCFARMMREHTRSQRQGDGRSYASER